MARVIVKRTKKAAPWGALSAKIDPLQSSQSKTWSPRTARGIKLRGVSAVIIQSNTLDLTQAAVDRLEKRILAP
jgi:hypothetical protein